MENKDRYPVFSVRLSKKTWLLLKERRKKSGLSWNLFLLKLLNNKTNK